MTPTNQITKEQAVEECIKRIRQSVTVFGGKFPYIGEGDGYVLGENNHWMASFWTGELWLAYVVTKDDFFKEAAEKHLASFRHRLDNNIDLSHDLGFLYTLSARTQYQLTGDEKARQLGLEAADKLIERFNTVGEYIQAWKAIGHKEEAGRFIVDCMMNLPLLYWATYESGNPRYAEIANKHAHTTLKYIVRPDYSTVHTYFLNPETGEDIGPKTQQGYADGSLWSRGQAWAIYGFTLAANWSNDSSFESAAMKIADRFLEEITPDYVPLWDFRLDEDAIQCVDTSAGAIAAMGMWQLAKRLTDIKQAEHYRSEAIRLIDALLGAAFDIESKLVNGLLRGSTYHANIPAHTEQFMLFGDYYFFEALINQSGQDVDFWGKPE